MIIQEKDFLMKLIQSFIDSLDRIINGVDKGKTEKQISLELVALTANFFKRKISFFIDSNMEEIVEFLSSLNYENRQFEAIANLLYQYGRCTYSEGGLKALKNAKQLFLYHQERTNSMNLHNYSILNAIDTLLKNRKN